MVTALGRTVVVALSLTFTVPLSAVAENSVPYSFDTCSAKKQCRQLSRAELGRLRGGLSVSGANSSMQLTFGITQVVYVNDELVALTQLLLPAVNQTLSPSTSASAATGPTGPTVFVNGVQATPTNPVVINVPSADELRALIVQNGAGNSVPNAADLRASTMATVIQNTRDNQTIRTVTTLNVSFAVSEARRAMAIGNAMRNSLK